MEEIKLAAWLHDCGKVTTPEYVVDKATKLETIYDRIHEIRMRFEVLKLQEEVSYWQALYNGVEAAQAKQTLDEKHRQLMRSLLLSPGVTWVARIWRSKMSSVCAGSLNASGNAR